MSDGCFLKFFSRPSTLSFDGRIHKSVLTTGFFSRRSDATEMENILSAKCSSFESIDDVLRSWLYLVASCRELYLSTEDDVAACSQRLRDSDVFGCNSEYVRTQIIYSLLQEDEAGPLHVIANFLLLDGRSDEVMFRRMIDDGCFPRLVELINGTRDNDRRLHRLLLELVYEMSRIERISSEDLMQVTDEFVQYMFQVIESLSDDVDDPYHYPIIRVLVCCLHYISCLGVSRSVFLGAWYVFGTRTIDLETVRLCS